MSQIVSLALLPQTRQALQTIVDVQRHAVKHVLRASIVLLSNERLSMLEVAGQAGVSRPMVWRWQQRFAEDGLDGLLRDKTWPPGTGKSHLAVALGVEAVRAGYSVYFSTLADLVSSLAKAEREGSLRQKIKFFCRFALLIVDEIGYLPVIPGGGNLFFRLVNACYERGSMILTSNRGFAEWGDVLNDTVVATALLDRLLHHAVVVQIEGANYRLFQHNDLVPDHIRTRALAQPSAVPLPRRRRRPPKDRSADPLPR